MIFPAPWIGPSKESDEQDPIINSAKDTGFKTSAFFIVCSRQWNWTMHRLAKEGDVHAHPDRLAVKRENFLPFLPFSCAACRIPIENCGEVMMTLETAAFSG